MRERARGQIDTLGLNQHPEGGWSRQVYKSGVRPSDGAERTALITIYFLLVEGTHSACHRVQSDEAWHFYERDALELLTRDSVPRHPKLPGEGAQTGALQPRTTGDSKSSGGAEVPPRATEESSYPERLETDGQRVRAVVLGSTPTERSQAC